MTYLTSAAVPRRQADTKRAQKMAMPSADAFVFFGATGDLAYKKIFPALQTLIRRGDLDMPIIGMGHAGWTLVPARHRHRGDGGLEVPAAGDLRRAPGGAFEHLPLSSQP
jgi:hypothetical protein